jgi:hypothetical protein
MRGRTLHVGYSRRKFLNIHPDRRPSGGIADFNLRLHYRPDG